MTSYKIFLKNDYNKPLNNLKVTKIKKTNYGFIIHLMTNYICLYYKYVTMGKNGSAKVKTIVDKNYHKKYQFTTYENNLGQNITLKEYKKINL